MAEGRRAYGEGVRCSDGARVVQAAAPSNPATAATAATMATRYVPLVRRPLTLAVCQRHFPERRTMQITDVYCG